MVLQQAGITVLPQPPSMGAVGGDFMLSGSDDGEPLDEEAYFWPAIGRIPKVGCLLSKIGGQLLLK